MNAWRQDTNAQATAAFVKMWRECPGEFKEIRKEFAALIFKVGFVDGMKEGITRARDILDNSGEVDDKSE